MGRMTRAKAAEVAQQLHVDEDAVLELPSDGIPQSLEAVKADAKGSAANTPERAPLGVIAPNSAESLRSEEVEGGGKTGKGRNGGKKGGKKNAAQNRQKDESGNGGEESGEGDAAAEGGMVDAVPEEEVMEEGGVAVNSPAEHAVEVSMSQSPAAEEVLQMEVESPAMQPAQGVEENVEEVMEDETADKTTAEEPFEIPTADAEADLPAIAISEQQQQPEAMDASITSPKPTLEEAPASPLASAMPSVIKSLRTDTPGKRSTSNKENVEPIVASPVVTPSATRTEQQPEPASPYDSLEDAVAQAATPPSRRRESSTRSGDAIEKMDELDDAVEKINQSIPGLSPSQSRKSPRQSLEAPVEALAPVEAPAPVEESQPVEKTAERTSEATEPQVKPAAPKSKTKPAPVVRTTKASAARLSLAQAPKNSTSTSTTTASKPTTTRPRPSTTLALGRSNSVRQSTTTTTKPVTKPATMPHSKARPVSLSFPTPPPPPKSSKAPTTSTFQLPGEAVAAKLKAAREAREKRDASGSGLGASKASEGPERKPSFKARPVPNFNKKPVEDKGREGGGAAKSVSALRPSIAGKGPGATQGDLQVSKQRPRPSTITVPSTSSSTAKPATKPSTTAVATPKAPRSSTAPTAFPAAAPSQRVPSNGTSKGREVFNRAALAKNAAEAEKRSKEGAAKKARNEAAERSRQMSREWAEKRKRAAGRVGKGEGKGDAKMEAKGQEK